MSPQFWQQVKKTIQEGDADEVARLIGDDEAKLTMSTVFGPWLHLAAKYGQLGVAKRLVSMGVDVNARGGVSQGTALDRAASGGHVDIVEYPLAHHAELDVSEPDRNPLFSAIYDGNPVEVNGDKEVHFYTLIPICAEERDLELRLGMPELLRRFEQNSVTTIVDGSRVNVAKDA